MIFSEAMELLQKGKKVTRILWKDSIYFVMNGKEVLSYQPSISNYIYNENILISDGWYIEGTQGEHKFCDIISYLNKGCKARMSHWEEETYIYLDEYSKNILVHCMVTMPFTPDFSSFNAVDWIEL